jgi:hypothetical protein
VIISHEKEQHKNGLECNLKYFIAMESEMLWTNKSKSAYQAEK